LHFIFLLLFLNFVFRTITEEIDKIKKTFEPDGAVPFEGVQLIAPQESEVPAEIKERDKGEMER
jgi:hypothetical protein